MSEYDKEILEYEIKYLEKKLKILKNLPEDAELIISAQGDNLVGYILNGERIYL